jgi:hypothetical protein
MIAPKHGSPRDRGQADYYYWRDRDPHYWPQGTGKGQRITDLTPEEIEEYLAGYDEAEEWGVRKEW